tara:strand:+ start:140 stop:388 length:249 start_codon:yes stop_codon:yes gene_type:complete
MEILKKAIKAFIILPNLPFIIAVAIYILINIYRHTGSIEMEFNEDDDLLTDKIKNHFKDIYPKHFVYFVALIFYVWYGLNVL